MGLFGFGKKKRQSEEAAEAAAEENDKAGWRGWPSLAPMLNTARRWNSGNHPSGTVR